MKYSRRCHPLASKTQTFSFLSFSFLFFFFFRRNRPLKLSQEMHKSLPAVFGSAASQFKTGTPTSLPSLANGSNCLLDKLPWYSNAQTQPLLDPRYLQSVGTTREIGAMVLQSVVGAWISAYMYIKCTMLRLIYDDHQHHQKQERPCTF